MKLKKKKRLSLYTYLGIKTIMANIVKCCDVFLKVSCFFNPEKIVNSFLFKGVTVIGFLLISITKM